MIRPNMIGRKIDYLAPAASTTPSAANIAALDSAWGTETLYPYAKSATVREDYDQMNLYWHNIAFAFTNKSAWGVFLSPDNGKKNLLFQYNISYMCQAPSNSANIIPYAIFGRKATNNSVVSDLTSQNNALDRYIILPGTTMRHSGGDLQFSSSGEIFTLAEDDKYNWCVALVLSISGAADVTVYNSKATIDMRKYQSELGVFRPSR